MTPILIVISLETVLILDRIERNCSFAKSLESSISLILNRIESNFEYIDEIPAPTGDLQSLHASSSSPNAPSRLE